MKTQRGNRHKSAATPKREPLKPGHRQAKTVKKTQPLYEEKEVIENNNAVEDGGEVDWEPTPKPSPGADEEG